MSLDVGFLKKMLGEMPSEKIQSGEKRVDKSPVYQEPLSACERDEVYLAIIQLPVEIRGKALLPNLRNAFTHMTTCEGCRRRYHELEAPYLAKSSSYKLVG